ncbi:MAG: polyribonucleotide nucleotidyltransferase [Anaerolineales bacterium]|nr:polyribonucleotide nucleotidyltransferase [Anaerolineales bacterium]
MQPNPSRFEAVVGDQTVIFESGHLAGQAGGALTIRVGDTLVLAAATMSAQARPGIDFLPLMVDYEERMYAGGRIPGSFFRREGRPTEQAILTSRLTDRSLRPLFAKELRNDIQVVLYSLSQDNDNPIDVLAVNVAAAALMISDIPWGGPVAAVRVGRIDGQFVINPSFEEIERSEINLLLSGDRDAVFMVEAGATEVPEAVMLEALQVGQQALIPLIEVQERMAAEIGKAKREDVVMVGLDDSLAGAVKERVWEPLNQLFDQQLSKADQYKAEQEMADAVIAEFAPEDEELAADVKKGFDKALKEVVRSRIVHQSKRPDGRGPADVRHIWSQVNISPQAHGSGLFTRGETQVLSLVTLGTPREAQELDNLTPVDSKRYIHHYNFPPFSTGEVRFMRGASRREVGHGALAEKALVPVIPDEADFPYTLRVVSEVLSSNGSTSMASVCGSTLALMDTGVPIKAPIAGVAMGLIKEGDHHVVLTDIQGLEDHLGDMDFKVAGSAEGITALQMDIKIKGITPQIMAQALEQAHHARLHILGKMMETISKPNDTLKPHTPRITIVKIPVDKIGAIIGPGGKMIRAIQDETNTRIDVEDDGSVFVAATDEESERAALERIELLTETPKIGYIYTGKVVRTADFGAFVEILPNTDGMVHISQLDSEHVRSVEDVVKVGDEVTVMVINIDPQGKIRLSRQAVLEGWTAEEAIAKDTRNQKGRSGGGRRGGRGNYRRDRQNRS